MNFKNKIIILFRYKLMGRLNLEALKQRGLKVGINFNMQQGCIIDESHCWLISIGNSVTLAPNVHILAHDASTKMFLGYTKIGIVTIGNNVFIGAGSIILPNVKIGNDVIIGVGSIVTKDIPDGTVVAGNPAKIICKIDEYLDKNKENMDNRPVYDEKWTIRKNISNDMKIKMINDLENGIGYLE